MRLKDILSFGLILILFISCDSQKEMKNSMQSSLITLSKTGLVNMDTPSNKFFTGENYLSINNISALPNNRITFTLKWDASWRIGDQYDAAWIFIKAKDQKGIWNHLKLVPNSSKLEANTSSDMAKASMKISPDRIGMMVYRKNNSQGNNNWTISVEIEDANKIEIIDLKVLGLEMVHIETGSFELGTVKSLRDRREVLTQGAGGAPYDPFFTFNEKSRDFFGGPYKVNSENPIEIGKKDGNLFWIDANIPGTNTFSGNPKGNLESKYPKGYQGFYQMKYELSQQEYCDFLNTLTTEQQRVRDISKVVEFDKPISEYRNAIVLSKGIYQTNRPNRPCNFISWLDGQAFADWAGLRHMTELEFEKSSRGSKPAVYREYVWGVNEIKKPKNMVYSSTFFKGNTLAISEGGSETTNGNIHASMFSYKNFIDVCTPQGNFYDPDCVGCRSFEGGDGGRGPVRKGIFGMNTKGNRISSGATFYGAMEMGGNLQEPVVTVGHPSGRKFQGSHGDGMLSENGFSTNLDWQPINKEYAFAGRGGCWKFHENHARTADRFKGLRTNQNRRASHIGFRGVRTDWNSY